MISYHAPGQNDDTFSIDGIYRVPISQSATAYENEVLTPDSDILEVPAQRQNVYGPACSAGQSPTARRVISFLGAPETNVPLDL